MKGFAIVASLLFLLVMTLFGFSVLLMASGHYSSSRNLFEKENARIACEAAAQWIVAQHNAANTTPAYLFDSGNWNGTALRSFQWNLYTISATFETPWTPTGINRMTLTARKGPFVASQTLELRQIRLENFALFSTQPQVLPYASLLDGLVFARGPIELQRPSVRFREFVYARVQPEYYASFRKSTLQSPDFPNPEQLISAAMFIEEARKTGIAILNRDALFWESGHYRLDLDQLDISLVHGLWQVKYRGQDLGNHSSLILWFDADLRLGHAEPPVSPIPSSKPRTPLYVVSSGNLQIESNLSPLESTFQIHPLCAIAGNAIHVLASIPRACHLDACLIAFGSEGAGGLKIEVGARDLLAQEREQFLFAVRNSAFPVEEEKNQALLDSLNAGEKIVWFRGSVILNAPMQGSSDLSQVHFESSGETYSLLPSLSFVYIVEGSRRWQ